MLIVLMCYMTYFNPASHFMAMSVATKTNFLGLDNFYMLNISSSLPLHANRFDVPHDLLDTASHFMAMSVATKINFLGLENFCMLYIASILPRHADRFDVLHDLLQHCFTLQLISINCSFAQ